MTMRRFFSAMGLASVGVVAVVLTSGADTVWAQTGGASPFDGRIAMEVKAIQAAETRGEPEVKLGVMWGALGSDYLEAGQVDQFERANTKALHLLKGSDKGKANYATVLDNMGSLELQRGRLEEAETLRRKALGLREELGDVLAIAISEGHVAEVEVARHRFAAGARDARAALEGLVAADDPDASDRLALMVTLTYALCSEKLCGEGLRVAREGMTLAKTSFQPGTLPMAYSLLALGYAQWKSGAKAEAEESIRNGVVAMRQAASPTSPSLVSALLEYRAFLQAGRQEAQTAALNQEIESAQGGASSACRDCTVSAYALVPRSR